MTAPPPTTAAGAASAVVPVELPPLEPPPVRTWPVHWLVAPLVAPLVLFFPRRLGPHLAASGWRAALVVGLTASIATPLAGALAITLWPPGGSVPAPRDLLADLVVEIMQQTSYSGTEWLPVAIAALATLLVATLASLMLMPWLAAGERGRHLFGRTLRLAAWSTAALPPLVFVSVGAGAGWYYWFHDSEVYSNEDQATIVMATTALAAAFVWLRTLLRLGERYGGPAAGPGFVPHEPRCEECGYRLALQPLSSRCPECGRPVERSLPQRRRTQLEPPGRWFMLTTLRAAWRLLWTRRAGDDLAVHRARPLARRFAVRVCLLLGLIGGTASFPMLWNTLDIGNPLRADDVPWWYAMNGLTWLLVCVASATACFWWLTLVTWLASWAGWRDAARRCVAVCYATPRLIGPVLLVAAGLWLAWGIDEHLPFSTERTRLFGASFSANDLAIAAAFLPALASLVLWLIHLARLLRATRYANA